MKYLEVAVEVESGFTETVADLFWEFNTGGVSIEDPLLLWQYINAQMWDAYEFPEKVLQAERATVRAYFPLTADIHTLLGQINEKLKALAIPFNLYFQEIDDEAWANSWKKYFKPIAVGEFLIKPTWEKLPSGEENKKVIEIDPGMAFGTGTHDTTALVLEALPKYIAPGKVVADVGTGSGILAIASALLGAEHVYAVDIDPVAVKVARENVILNRLSGKVSVIENDLLHGFATQVNVIIANIIAAVIKELAPDAFKKLTPGGIFIGSGIILEREQEVLDKLLESGFTFVERQNRGGWSLLVVRKE
ncbi:50S ribosomal protein L11 methyltransferase [Carboxydothermus pertinax]|uniref:Ribosomal protein L11 methyltransferase n=1 Tax=Carboxydothermus pertinax TaxID=870242 RepID=A0A1L8CT73_9THEO|nr:50S ribosomal protein L11 methyltransferase [Carboxydothermus pertinax]GAV22044.1 ribosomal protein L11 methyltransferase [Carboxydothermus pertinax]